MTRLATEEAQIIIYMMLSIFLSKPTMFPKLQHRGRGWLWSANQSSRGGSIPRATGVTGFWQILVNSVLVGWSSRSFALIIRLVLCLVHWCFTSDFIMVFPVACINRLSECTEVRKVVRFTYSRNLILDPGWKSIVELMPE